jgi:type IV secretion system protein VirB10
MLVVGDSEKGVDGPQGPAPLAGNPGYMKTSAMSGSGSLNGSEGSGEAGGDSLGNMLRPTVVSGTTAGKLASRTFMMTQGTLLDCNLDVAISSAVPGMTKCTLTRSIWSDDRKIVLLERGTELTGQYQGGMQQGVPRMFILWTRAKTPAGVIIALNSPGTDALGRGGVDGYIDNHFWERFGSALFLSVIDDGLAYLAASAQNNKGSDNTTVVLPQATTQASKNAASIAVENSIRIPSTLSKNQGEHVSVFVARDLDFRTVYAIKATDTGE